MYYVCDHLNSTSGIYDSSALRVKKIKYEPFGVTALDTGISSEDHLYNGKVLDDTGLYYYGARYYDAALGRFITADSIVPGDGAAPQALNRYSYCLNNPMIYTDPSGHSPENNNGVGNAWKDSATSDSYFWKWDMPGAVSPFDKPERDKNFKGLGMTILRGVVTYDLFTDFKWDNFREFLRKPGVSIGKSINYFYAASPLPGNELSRYLLYGWSTWSMWAEYKQLDKSMLKYSEWGYLLRNAADYGLKYRIAGCLGVGAGIINGFQDCDNTMKRSARMIKNYKSMTPLQNTQLGLSTIESGALTANAAGYYALLVGTALGYKASPALGTYMAVTALTAFSARAGNSGINYWIDVNNLYNNPPAFYQKYAGKIAKEWRGMINERLYQGLPIH